MRKKIPRRLTKALLETADDMRRGGVLDSANHEKITLHHQRASARTQNRPQTPETRYTESLSRVSTLGKNSGPALCKSVYLLFT
jgi:hypothetical protein